MNVADTIIRHAGCETIQSNVLSLQNNIQEPVSINLSFGPSDCIIILETTTFYLFFLRNEDGNIVFIFLVSLPVSLQKRNPKEPSSQNYRKKKNTFPANSMSFPVMLKVVSQRLHERAHYSKSSSSNELFLVWSSLYLKFSLIKLAFIYLYKYMVQHQNKRLLNIELKLFYDYKKTRTFYS